MRYAVKVRGECFKDIRPVDTVMEVSRFINPEWLVEVEVDAVVDPKLASVLAIRSCRHLPKLDEVRPTL